MRLMSPMMLHLVSHLVVPAVMLHMVRHLALVAHLLTAHCTTMLRGSVHLHLLRMRRSPSHHAVATHHIRLHMPIVAHHLSLHIHLRLAACLLAAWLDGWRLLGCWLRCARAQRGALAAAAVCITPTAVPLFE